MSSALVEENGRTRQLDKPAQAEQVTTAEDVQDPETLARLVQQLRTEVATLKRAFSPKRIDFDRVSVTGGAVIPQAVSFQHGLNGRVRWWVIGWESSVADKLDIIERASNPASTATTLVLNVYATGRLSLRIEEVG
jgi:hypothetical protein